MVKCRGLSTMALNIRDSEVERLAVEVANLAHETKTEAVRTALIERRAKLQTRSGKAAGSKRLREYLENEVWPSIPADELGRAVRSEEEDRTLGYGPEGY
jgi:antitoxin VapB